MNRLLDTLKPAAPVRVHLLAAAVAWTLVGAGLLFFGARWALASQSTLVHALLAAAVIGGWLKARFMLRRAAHRTISRIRARGDGRCLGGFLPLWGWALVALMMGMGFALRHGLLPHPVVGLIYVAIGSALLTGSLSFWRAWHAG
jgi:hypothetical protein